ncbi:hypothetical protein L7F22_031809 [Adiantum nelumboides]|nr:hypothetical protein [Adiantum nelumboides]
MAEDVAREQTSGAVEEEDREERTRVQGLRRLWTWMRLLSSWRTTRSTHPVQVDQAEDQGTQNHLPLLPGIPDSVALLCLSRLPLSFLGIARRVSKGWNAALQPDKIVALRQHAGISSDLVFVFATRNICGVLHRFLLAVDPWLSTISAVPCPEGLLNREVHYEIIPGVCGEVLWLERDKVLNRPLPQLFVLNYLHAHWKSFPSMATLTGGNNGLISVTIGRYAYFTGGWRDGHPSKGAECLDLSTKQWSRMPDCHFLRLFGLGVVMDGRFLVFSGLPRSNSAEQWQPETGEWKTLKDIWSKDLKLRRPYIAMVNGQLFAMKNEKTVARFQPLTNSWLQLDSISTYAGSMCALLCVGSKIWVLLECPNQGTSIDSFLLEIYVAHIGEVPALHARWERLPFCIEGVQATNSAAI